MGIGDHELDAAQPPAGQLAQELRPDRLGLGGADLHAQHLAPSVAVDADGDDDGDRHDAPATTDFQIGRVDPQIGLVAFDRPLQEGFHLAIDLFAQTRDTWLFEMPLMPNALTSSSTERVEMPCT